jgi:hypothetical protein
MGQYSGSCGVNDSGGALRKSGAVDFVVDLCFLGGDFRLLSK